MIKTMRIFMKRETALLARFLLPLCAGIFLLSVQAPAQAQSGGVSGLQAMDAAKARAEKWAEKALTETLTFTGLTAADVLAHNRDKFSDTGWRDLSGFLQGADVLEDVTGKRLDISAERIEDPALVIDVKDDDGNYYWEVDLPLRLEIKSEAGRVMRKYIFSVHIRQQDSAVVIDQVKASKVQS